MIKIEIDDRAIRSALQGVIDVSQNLRPMPDEIGVALTASTKLRFKDQVDPNEKPWEPLSEFTISRRRKNGENAKALLDTGRLRNSITHLVGADFVEVGTNVAYAATHQFGAKKGQYGRYYQLFRLKYGEKDFRRYAGMRTGHPKCAIETVFTISA